MSFNTLPKPAKNVIVIGGAILTGLAIWKVYSIIQRHNQNKSNTLENKAVDQQLQIEIAKAPASLTPAQINTFVSQLKEALGGWKTDEETVYHVFDQIKNESDILSLMKAYGTQKIDYPIGSFTGTLSQTIAHDMDRSSMLHKSINDINENLKKKNIKTQF